MMRPLRNSGAPTSPIEADAIELLRAAPGYGPPAGQKQRIRARLLQQRVGRRALRLRPAVVAIVILFCAAAASAAAGRHWIAKTIGMRLGAPAVKQLRSPSLAAPRARRAEVVVTSDTPEPNAVTSAPIDIAAIQDHAKRRETTDVTTDVTTESEPKPVTSPPRRTLAARDYAKPRGSHRAKVVGADGVDARPSNKSVAPASPRADTNATEQSGSNVTHAADDTGLVFEAMRALRQDGHPARASRLLDDYLQRCPAGSLAEEALALSVEAAAARGDAHARDLAQLYGRRYPHGNFTAAVEIARARLSP
jgi:hypothetical protein